MAHGILIRHGVLTGCWTLGDIFKSLRTPFSVMKTLDKLGPGVLDRREPGKQRARSRPM